MPVGGFGVGILRAAHIEILGAVGDTKMLISFIYLTASIDNFRQLLRNILKLI